jgi:hypothetical protein
MGIDVHCALK